MRAREPRSNDSRPSGADYVSVHFTVKKYCYTCKGVVMILNSLRSTGEFHRLFMHWSLVRVLACRCLFFLSFVSSTDTGSGWKTYGHGTLVPGLPTFFIFSGRFVQDLASNVRVLNNIYVPYPAILISRSVYLSNK